MYGYIGTGTVGGEKSCWGLKGNRRGSQLKNLAETAWLHDERGGTGKWG